LVKFF
jgi:hypothetical protein